MAPSDVETAKNLTEEGNRLYNSNKSTEAITAYKKAFRLDPTTIRPLRNLSSAYYEAGLYRLCQLTAAKAVDLEREAEVEDAAQVKKLEARIEKANSHMYEASVIEQTERRIHALERLPRYRPDMTSGISYVTVGHDEADFLLAGLIDTASCPKDDVIAVLLGGCGDCRHMFKTLIDIVRLEKRGRVPTKRYHFTANDIHHYTLARNLVIWMLLEELSELNSKSDEALLVLTTLCFVWIGTMMPEAAHQKVRQVIRRLWVAVNKGEQPMEWVFLHEKDFQPLQKAFHNWDTKVLQIVSGTEVVARVVDSMKNYHVNSVPPRNQQEWHMYAGSSYLQSPERFLTLYDKDFWALLKVPGQTPQNLGEHIAKCWRVNVTLIAVDNPENNDCSWSVDHDPFPEINSLGGTNTSATLLGYIAPFFEKAASSLKQIKDRLKVEVYQADVVDFAEKVQFGLFGTTRPDDFPIKYHRMALSNVPDYIGGDLPTFIHTMPLVERKSACSAQFNCQRNPQLWKTYDDFSAHYSRVYNNELRLRLTGVAVTPSSEFMGPLGPLINYTRCSWGSSAQTLPYESLLPRAQFTKWFYSIFFHIILPFGVRDSNPRIMVHSPLNLPVIFRLISHLRSLGYPSHWLSEILSSIIQNKATTTARPPRSRPTTIAEARKEHPSKKLSTAPFTAEMGMLACIFEPILPFNLSYSRKIPILDDIHHYTINLPYFFPMMPQVTCLVFILWDESALNACRVGEDTPMRELLDPSYGDEIDRSFRGPTFEKFREESVVVWSTFRFDIETKRGSVWMPRDVVDRAVSKGWVCGIWRVDLWGPMFMQPEKVKGALVRGEKWEN